MNPQTFDAGAITDYQACRRKFSLASSYRPLRWNPRFLHDALLRHSALQLSQGKELYRVRDGARSQYLQSAANPGLDVPQPYPTAMEYVALLNVLVTALPRMGVPQGLVEPPAVDGWRASAFLEPRVGLHRWITVDHWDEARQRQELHSWWVAGDIASANLPMTLHVIEIGQMRNGRRVSPWVRGWRHPKLPNVRRVRFRLSERGKTFRGWDPVWLTDHPNQDLDDWVDWIWGDGPDQLFHTIQVDPPSYQKRREVLGDIRDISCEATKEVRPWRELPMSRGACDLPGYPCPFQPVCYEDADPETSGLFVALPPHRPA